MFDLFKDDDPEKVGIMLFLDGSPKKKEANFGDRSGIHVEKRKAVH